MPKYEYASKIYLNSNYVYASTNVVSADLNNVEFVGNSAYGFFENCKSLTSVSNIHSNVQNMSYFAEVADNLEVLPTLPPNVVNLTYAFRGIGIKNVNITFPNSIETMNGCFAGCNKLVSFTSKIPTNCKNISHMVSYSSNLSTFTPEIHTNVEEMWGIFGRCSKLGGNFYVRSNKIVKSKDSNGVEQNLGLFEDNSSLRRDFYIPYYTKESDYTIHTTTYNTFISSGYDENGTLENVYLHDIDLQKIQINVQSPSVATVKMKLSTDTNWTTGDTFYTYMGRTVQWEVSKEGYITQSGSFVVSEPKTISVSLSKKQFTFTINPTPSDATVKLIATGYTQSGNSITVPYDTNVNWSVEKMGWVTQSGTEKIVSNITKNITLADDYVTLTVNAQPDGAVIDFGGQDMVSFTIRATPSTANIIFS